MASHKIQVFSGACFPHITCFTVLLPLQHNHVKPICAFPNCSLCLYNCMKLFALFKNMHYSYLSTFCFSYSVSSKSTLNNVSQVKQKTQIHSLIDGCIGFMVWMGHNLVNNLPTDGQFLIFFFFRPLWKMLW